jgi:uncharacterized protein
MELYKTIRSQILQTLGSDLSKDLLYHCLQHTIDVETQAQRIAASENIVDPESVFLLKVATLYHDSGFLVTYKEHEAASCELAKKQLPGFGLNQEQLDVICGLIMATKIPQTPLTLLEEIICDADLDYLGRNDFPEISNNLFLELKTKGFIKTETEWNLIQVSFFKQHYYFTDTNKALRQQQKLKYLEMIESSL